MDTHEQTHRRAVLYLVCAAILWSTAGLLIKLIQWQPFAIAGMRSAVAALLLWAYVRRPRFTWSAAQIGGAVAYAGTVVLFGVANKNTTAANAILLQYTAPIYIALFSSWFLGERVRPLDWATIGLVLVGLALFLLDGLDSGNWYGDGLAMGSAVCFAALILFLRKQKDEAPLESVILGNILAALIGLPFMFGPVPDLKSWLGMILLGSLQLGLSYLLYVKGIQHVTALEGVLVPVIEPLLNPLWVLLLLGEKPSAMALTGGLIVLGAVLARGIINSRLKPAAPALAEG
ncbi:MAG: DMT family transporter [Blastocatellia bacterium]